MREIRLALLEADVNFKVVKSFTNAVKERALGADMIGKLNPGQQVVKIVSDELTELMGGAARELSFSPRPPTVVLMAGLQGSGKTTATGQARALPAHRARLLGGGGRLRRLPPGRRRSADQGRHAGRRRRLRAGHRPQPGRHRRVGRATAPDAEGKDVLIVDTSGRLHVDAGADDRAGRHQEGRSTRTTSCSSSTR